jgi:hypothetical protein
LSRVRRNRKQNNTDTGNGVLNFLPQNEMNTLLAIFYLKTNCFNSSRESVKLHSFAKVPSSMRGEACELSDLRFPPIPGSSAITKSRLDIHWLHPREESQKNS